MSLNYRPEIDGLRAIAVTPVILFHAGIEAFSGGFIGVDIFFVISGYLITCGILHDLNEGKFSIVKFYERRARRILPALFFILFASFIASWFILIPSHMKEFVQSMATAVVFASNIFFYINSGYFNTAAEFQPLLHTWSLAIEEQFYLIFPTIMVSIWFISKQRLAYILSGLAVLSLGWASWSSVNGNMSGSFYLLTSRGWELLAGSLSAVALTRPDWKGLTFVPTLAKQFFSILGLCLIIVSFFTFTHFTPHPSYFTLIPVIGTVCIILFASKHTLTGRILSNRIFVGIGLISYSLYLWHHPIFVFDRYKALSPPSEDKILILLILTLLLSIFSWHFIERPFRDPHRVNNKHLIIFLGLTVLAIGTITISENMNNSFSGRIKFSPNLQWANIGQKLFIEGEVCEKKPVQGHDFLEQCYFGDLTSDKTIGLVGDSHALAISKSLDEELKRRKFRGSYIQYIGTCETISGSAAFPIGGYTKEVCDKSFVDLQNYAYNNLDSLILIERWAYRLYPVEGAIHSAFFDNSKGGIETRFKTQGFAAIDENGNPSFSQTSKKRILEKTINGLSTSTKLLLVYPVPEVGYNIFQMNMQYYKEHDKILEELIFPSEEYDARNKFIINIFDEIAQNNQNIVAVKTRDVFCDNMVLNNCVAQYAGIPFYLDSDHLSDAGATLVVNEIFKQYVTDDN